MTIHSVFWLSNAVNFIETKLQAFLCKFKQHHCNHGTSTTTIQWHSARTCWEHSGDAETTGHCSPSAMRGGSIPIPNLGKQRSPRTQYGHPMQDSHHRSPFFDEGQGDTFSRMQLKQHLSNFPNQWKTTIPI
jgi:hypothetical protein